MALEDAFPNLGSAYEITSPATRQYNCIAWAAGRADQWWEPAQGYYWPANAPREGTVVALVRLFQSLGYEFCATSDLEPGWTKIVIYEQSGDYTHAARQLPSGAWTSKLGAQVDIEHPTIEGLVGAEYGRVSCILRRLTPAAPSHPAP